MDREVEDSPELQAKLDKTRELAHQGILDGSIRQVMLPGRAPKTKKDPELVRQQ
jgi:hypothetical protein